MGTREREEPNITVLLGRSMEATLKLERSGRRAVWEELISLVETR